MTSVVDRLLGSPPRLADGERLVATRFANHRQGPVARGGRLFVTNRRLAFRPHVLDLATGASALDVEWSEVADVDVAPRTLNPLDGGVRRRLRVTTRSGTAELFVVNSADELAALVRRHAREGPSA